MTGFPNILPFYLRGVENLRQYNMTIDFWVVMVILLLIVLMLISLSWVNDLINPYNGYKRKGIIILVQGLHIQIMQIHLLNWNNITLYDLLTNSLHTISIKPSWSSLEVFEVYRILISFDLWNIVHVTLIKFNLQVHVFLYNYA